MTANGKGRVLNIGLGGGCHEATDGRFISEWACGSTLSRALGRLAVEKSDKAICWRGIG